MKPRSEYARGTPWYITLDIGRPSSEAVAETEDFVDRASKGIRICHSNQLYHNVELMNLGNIESVMILVSTNNVSSTWEAEKGQWEEMLVYHFAAVCREFNGSVLIICTLPINTRTKQDSARRQNERVFSWKKLVCNLVSRNDGRLVLMDIEH